VIGVAVALHAGVVPVVAVTVTTSPFASAVVEYVAVVEGPCTIVPFILNVYVATAGPPPLVAVNVTLLFTQIVVALAPNVGVGFAFTVMVIPALVTLHDGPVPDVAITVTTSPFTRAELV